MVPRVTYKSTRHGLTALAVTASLGFAAYGQGYAPTEAVRHMKVPARFTVTPFASEPMIRQPVAMEFDDRGRLWVIQYLQYPNPAGLERVKVDRYSRTVYDRVPQPPPRGPRGADRITILEDTDGDGRADKAKDFINGLNLASGLAFGSGGVYVLQVPYLLFYPDRDGDDVPDGEPEVLLKGFGMEDAHSVANSLTWGPDGWLYGNQGSTVTANIRGITFQQGVWRYHPRDERFELFFEGGGNMWGLDFDAAGNLFSSTNFGPYIVVHGVQGGYYWKQFSKHGQLHNPYTFGYFNHAAHTGPNVGHVAVGGVFYEANALPPEFRGKYVAANLLSHDVYWHDVRRSGSTFTTVHAGELLISNDTWFAPSDVTLGPDGAIYVADWHDKRTAHPDPDAEWDRSNGRVLRIQYGSGTTPAVPDLRGLDGDRLVALLDDANSWTVRRARRILAERRDVGVLGRLERRIFGESNPRRALESLWALYGVGGLDDALAGRLLRHRFADVRRWTVRFLGDAGIVAPDIGKTLLELARSDPDVTVRSQLAGTAKRLPAHLGLRIAYEILLRDQDGDDPHVPLLCWWAIEHHAVTAMDDTLELFASARAWKSKTVREEIIGRLVRRYIAEPSPPALMACARLFNAAPDASGRHRILKTMDQALQGKRFDRVPSGLTDLVREIWRPDTNDETTIRVAARLGSGSARRRAFDLAVTPTTEEKPRVAMINLLGQVSEGDVVEPLLGLLGAEESEAIRRAAVAALQRFDDPRVARALVSQYPSMTQELKARARDLLFSRAASARAFLETVDAGRVPAEEVPAEQLRRLDLLGDDTVTSLVRKHWGTIRASTPGEKLAEVRRFNNDLRAAEGDPEKGKDLFKNICAKCHTLFGEGEKTGPDLTQANRKDRDFLLVSIVDPSAAVRKEYLNFIVKTRDGRILNGLIVDRTPSTLTLVDAESKKTVLSTEDVEVIKESSVSLMPEELLKPLTPDELRDLFSYLQK